MELEMELGMEPKEGDRVWIWDGATSRPIFVTLGRREGVIFKATSMGAPEKAFVISMFAQVFDTAKACHDSQRAFVADQLAQFTRCAERERVVLEFLEGAARESAMKLAHFNATVERMQSELDSIGAWEVTE